MNGILFYTLNGNYNCYILRFGDTNILIDCGVRKSNDKKIFNNREFDTILKNVKYIFISHAHMDHIGYLDRILENCPNAIIYMTRITYVLMQYQFNSHINNELLYYTEQFNNNTKLCFVDYNKDYIFDNFKVVFFKAGHIPGAAMIYFAYGYRTILYTGDFLIHPTELTSGCILPQNLKVDILIMSGIYASDSNESNVINRINRVTLNIIQKYERYKHVYCRVKQLTKGVELLKDLNIYLTKNKINAVKIGVDAHIYDLITYFEKLGIAILNEDNYIINNKNLSYCNIILGLDSKINYPKFYCMDIDFSLHEKGEGIYYFIKKLNPNMVVIVEIDDEKLNYSMLLKKLIEDDVGINNIIFLNENEVYGF